MLGPPSGIWAIKSTATGPGPSPTKSDLLEWGLLNLPLAHCHVCIHVFRGFVIVFFCLMDTGGHRSPNSEHQTMIVSLLSL